MKYMKIVPDDLLLFRDDTKMDKGKERDGSEPVSNLITSKMLPYPSVFWGAIFTSLLRSGKLPDVQEALTTGSLEKQGITDSVLARHLSIGFLGIMIKGKIYIPAPLDLFYDKNGATACIRFEKGGFSIPPLRNLTRAENMLIELEDYLNYYLEEEYSEVELYSMGEFFDSEYRTGIEVENRIAREGHLYRIQFMQFKEPDSGFLIGYDTDKIVEDGRITIGGERKTAHMKLLPQEDIFDSNYGEACCSTGKIKLTFLSPFVLPESDVENVIKDLFQNKITLAGIASGGLEEIKGFDMAKGRSKESIWALCAGSILYLESEIFLNKSYLEIYNSLNVKMKKNPLFYRGFGTYLLSEW